MSTINYQSALLLTISLLGLAVAKEPTILFLGPNGVRPLNGNNYGSDMSAAASAASAYGQSSQSLFGGFPSGLASALSSFRDQESSSGSNFNIFRIGEKFQDRMASQKKGPRIIVIPPLAPAPKPSSHQRYASYANPMSAYGGYHSPHAYAASTNHYSTSPYRSPYAPARSYYMSPMAYPVGQAIYGGYGWRK